MTLIYETSMEFMELFPSSIPSYSILFQFSSQFHLDSFGPCVGKFFEWNEMEQTHNSEMEFFKINTTDCVLNALNEYIAHKSVNSYNNYFDPMVPTIY